MPRSAEDPLNPQPFSARSNWNAVVASLDVGLHNADIARHLDMNTIRIRAITRRNNVDTDHFYVLAAKYHNVVELAVCGGHTDNFDVLWVGEGKGLQA